MLTTDNFDFFAADATKLKQWKTTFFDTGNLSKDKNVRQQSPCGRRFSAAEASHNRWQTAFQADDYSAQERIVKDLADDQERRLIFYLILKTSRRHNVKCDSDPWWLFFKEELANHCTGIEILAEQKARTVVSDVARTVVATGKGKYSANCYLDLRRSKAPVVKVMTATDLAKYYRQSIDVIVTDPPYGFNTEEDQRSLADLYRRIIPVFLSALKNDSQLVISIPEWSHTGRQLPAFTYKEFLTHQILITANELGIDVIRAPYSVPATGVLFRPPFYWESERALRRAILHFRFQRRRIKNL